MVNSNPESAEDESGASPSPEGGTFKDKLYSKVAKEITDSDLTNPGVVRLILAQKEELASENKSLKSIRDLYYREQRELGKAEEREKKNIAFDCFCDFIMALGGIFAGLCTTDFSQGLKLGSGLMLILAGICIVGGQLMKRMTK